MIAETNTAPSSPAELLGDLHPLLEQVGTPEEMAMTAEVAHAIQFRDISNLPSLRRFLDAYRDDVLVPIELPAIVAAYQYAARGEVKELIALDGKLAADRTLQPFAIASCRVGQRQLSKLRPMRDQRLVQRYLVAIDEGQARGWHTIVYGVSLAIFSLPLRQGLQHYGEQTLLGFVHRAARSLRLSEVDCSALLAAQCGELPRAIGGALDSGHLIG